LVCFIQQLGVAKLRDNRFTKPELCFWRRCGQTLTIHRLDAHEGDMRQRGLAREKDLQAEDQRYEQRPAEKALLAKVSLAEDNAIRPFLVIWLQRAIAVFGLACILLALRVRRK
jgi:hypothetical protein